MKILSVRSFLLRLCSFTLPTACVFALFLASLGFCSRAYGAPLSTDQLDYGLGSTAFITGNGFTAGETVQVQVLHTDGTPNNAPDHDPWLVVADDSGNFLTEWCVCQIDDVGSTLQVTATGLTSTLTADATFTDSPIGIDFSQYVNGNAGTNDSSWVGGAINGNKAFYAEGMCVPQRLILTGLAGTNHVLSFQVLASKGGFHAYDFLTSWPEAVSASDLLVAPGLTLMANLLSSSCNPAIGSAALSACNALHDPTNAANLAVIDISTNGGGALDMGFVPFDPTNSVQKRVVAFQGSIGSHLQATLIGNKSFIGTPTFEFQGYISGSGEYYAVYNVSWISTADAII